MSNEVYAITDLKGYVTEMREAAASSFCDSFEEDLDGYINLNQMMNLVKSECLGFDDENRPLLNEEANEKIYESTVTWIHNVGLAKLAAKDLVQCAWDSKNNEMIFWAKENDTNAKPKRKNKKPKR